MKEKINTLLSDKIIRLSAGIAVILICVLSGLILTLQQRFPPVAPVFNSFPWGDDRLADSNILMTIPPILIIAFLVNNILSLWLYKKHTLVARVLSFNALLFVLLGVLAYLQIVFLVF